MCRRDEASCFFFPTRCPFRVPCSLLLLSVVARFCLCAHYRCSKFRSSRRSHRLSLGSFYRRSPLPPSPRPPPPRPPASALLTVARPRARPTPRPRTFRDLNIGAFLFDAIVSLSSSFCSCIRRDRSLGRNVPEHIRDDEEAHVAAADIHLLEMADAAVARGHGDVFELDIHVVLGWKSSEAC